MKSDCFLDTNVLIYALAGKNEALANMPVPFPVYGVRLRPVRPSAGGVLREREQTHR